MMMASPLRAGTGVPGRRLPSRGFSLVEILVVLVILSILVTLIFAGSRQARMMADNVRCQDNLRNWGLAITTYAQDNGMELPALSSGASDTYSSWVNRVVPYLGGEALGNVYYGHNVSNAYCPAFEKAANGVNVRVANGIASSYTANARLMPITKLLGQSYVRLPSITRPTETMLLMDGLPYPQGRDGVFYRWQLRPPADGGFGGYLHQQRLNVLFVDGHVDSISGGDIDERVYATDSGLLF